MYEEIAIGIRLQQVIFKDDPDKVIRHSIKNLWVDVFFDPSHVRRLKLFVQRGLLIWEGF